MNSEHEAFTFENHGRIWLVRAHTPEAEQHLRDNVANDVQWFGPALVVEPRYVMDLAAGLQDAGFSVDV